MTTKPLAVPATMTIREVAGMFLEQGYTSAPVIGSTGAIMGIIDEFSLIKAKLIQHIEDHVGDQLSHHAEYLIPAHCVRLDTPLTEVVREMIKSPNHRVLVLNSAKALVGIISPKDVLRYVTGVHKQVTLDLKKELAEAKESLEHVKKELSKTRSRLGIYKDIVMDNPSMIHSVDGDGKILMANHKMHQLLGYDSNELVGKTIFDLYAPAMHSEALNGLNAIKSTGSHQNTFTTMLRKNGERLRIDIVSSALYDEDENFIATVSVSRPVDSDILLRALHGVIRNDSDDHSRAKYGDIKSFEAEFSEARETVKAKAKKKA